MELKPDYKQTDIGVLPKDWKVKTLGSVSDIKTGPFGSALHERDYVVDGTPIITVEHLGESGVTHENLPMVSDFDRRRLGSYSLQENDVVFSRVGSVDRNSLIRTAEVGWLFSGRLLRVRPNAGEVFAPYLSFHFHDEPFKQRVRSVAVGQTMPSLNTQILKGLKVALPPLSEQRAIAEALGDVDELLDELERLLAKKRDLKVAAMQQLLTEKKRLAGFQGEWTTKPLKEIAQIRSGGTPSTIQSSFWDGNVFWCTPTDITALQGGKYLDDTARKISAAGLKASSAEIIPSYSIVMTSRATIGECAINRMPVTTNQGFKNFVPFENINTDFLYYLLLMQKQAFIALCSGSTFLEIGKGQLINFELRLPEQKEEQIAIAEILSDMDTEIAELEAQRDKTRDLKTAMMQQLLTGQTRLIARAS